MGMIFVGLFIMTLGLAATIAGFQGREVMGMIIVGLIINIMGIGVLLSGIKQYFFSEQIDALKKLVDQTKKEA